MHWRRQALWIKWQIKFLFGLRSTRRTSKSSDGWSRFVDASTLDSKTVHYSRLWHSARVGHLVANIIRCNWDVLFISSWIVWDLSRHAHSSTTTRLGCVVSGLHTMDAIQGPRQGFWAPWKFLMLFYTKLHFNDSFYYHSHICEEKTWQMLSRGSTEHQIMLEDWYCIKKYAIRPSCWRHVDHLPSSPPPYSLSFM